ncbi:MAG: hypothetical protein KBE91_11885 [Bacteroidia bacterium]|nr:hypothetical protein [Bacteroidia bacterium]
MPKIKNIVGNTYARWSVVSYSRQNKGKSVWNCLCECGTTKEVDGASLKNGASKSCGCYNMDALLKRGTHKMSKSSEYFAYNNMLDRCYNKTNNSYANYGGRGVTVCSEWLNSYEKFISDVGNKPTKLHSLDRIDNSKGYSKENCKWATKLEQANNKRNNVIVLDLYTGVFYTSLSDAAKYNNIDADLLSWQLINNKSLKFTRHE